MATYMDYADWEWPEMVEAETLRWPASWSRPALLDPMADAMAGRSGGERRPLSFQNVETTYRMRKEHRTVPGAQGGTQEYVAREVPEIVMCGTNEAGNSVCARIWGFRPYFRVGIESGTPIDQVEHVVHARLQTYLNMDKDDRERLRISLVHISLAYSLLAAVDRWFDPGESDGEDARGALDSDSRSSDASARSEEIDGFAEETRARANQLASGLRERPRCPHHSAVHALRVDGHSPIDLLLHQPLDKPFRVSFSHDNESTSAEDILRERDGVHCVDVHCVTCKDLLSFGEYIRNSLDRPDFLKSVVESFFELVEETIVEPLREFYHDCAFTRFDEWPGIAPPNQQYVSRVDLETATHTQFIGYTQECVDTLRVELFRPGDCTVLRNAIQYAGLLLDLSGLERMERCGFLQTYESDVPFVLRFSIDRDIKGMGWVDMREWSAVPVNNRDRLSKCQIEVVVDDPLNVEGDNAREEMAPLRCLGFDCEMAATNVQRFVNAKNTGDALTQISCVVYEQGRMDDPIELCIFCLGGCEPLLRRAQRGETITDEERAWYGRTRIYSFDSERALLLAFRRFFEINAFDLVYGYNSVAFDMPWLFDRSNNVAALGAGMPVLFGKLGKLIERRVPTGEDSYRWRDLITAGIESFRSNQAGTREYRCIRIPMVRQFDIMIAVMSNRKFRSYGLNAVGRQLAKKEKIELDHVGITKHAVSPLDIHRSVVSRYCMWDTLLTMEVGILRESYDVVYSEMARVTGVTMKELLTRGQTIKTYTQLIGFLKRTRETPDGRSFIIPYVRPCPIDLNPSTFDNAWMVEGENDDLEDIYGIFERLFYEGGYVFEPKRGFYTDVIFCLDYKSLYPNIIISFNLCYTTYIAGRAAAEALGLRMAWDFREGPIPSGHAEPEGDFYVYPGDHCFVKRHVREGILPLMLKDTLAARAKMRGFQKNYDYGTPEWLRYNAAQLAFKVTANSAYGFTGARKLAARYIAATVTFIGRTIIQQADRMSIAYGESHPGFENENVYGDTDSIMNRFTQLERDDRLHGKTEGPLDAFTFETLLRSAHMAVEIAKFITADFRHMGYSTIELEFEKIYYGAVFLMRKKYGVYKYEFDARSNQLKPRVSTSGLETVRRDTTEFLQSVYDRVIRMVVEEKDLDGAIRYAQDEVAKLRDGQVPTRRLVYTGNFGKAAHEYVNPVPHIEAVKRAMEIDPMLAPRVGQRISYVVVRRFPKDDAKESALKVHQKSEVYQVVRASKGAMIPDYMHYVEKTVDAISRFFAACIASHMSQDEGQAYAARRVFYDKFREQEAKRKLETSSILAGLAKQKKRKVGSTKSEEELRREMVEAFGGKRKAQGPEAFTADRLRTTATTLAGFFRSAGMSKKGKKFKESK